MSVYIDKVKENKGAKKVGEEARAEEPKERDKKSRKAKKR